MGSEDVIIRLTKDGYDCAQCVLKAMEDRLDCDMDTAMRSISSMGMGLLEGEELTGARKVLTAAALTYVAALATTLMQLLRFILLVSDRRR